MEYNRAWKFGSNINTDIISPPEYMERPIDEAKLHAMAPVDESFGRSCRPGDIFVAGDNLGSGSSRETAPLALKALGIRYVVARSFARIFYRNCINIGLLPLECALAESIATGDELAIDPAAGTIHNRTKNETYPCSKLPEHVLGIADSGGLLEYIIQNR